MRNDANIRWWWRRGQKDTQKSYADGEKAKKNRNSFRRNDLQTGLYKIERQLRIQGAPRGGKKRRRKCPRTPGQQLARDGQSQNPKGL